MEIRCRTNAWEGELFLDAASCHPTVIPSSDEDNMDNHLAAIYKPTIDVIKAITWDMVKQENPKDTSLTKLIIWIQKSFPTNCQNLEPEIRQYWDHKADLFVIDDVIMLNDRVIILLKLQSEVLDSLHAAHQGTTSMNE